ncbi:MAG: hypothetical protein ACFFD2_15130 [Promethearchaeota archaeon]
MSEEGKNIIIDFTEKEESIYKPPGNLEKLEVTGDINIINPSNEHRLWNIILSLKGLKAVESELDGVIKVGEVNPKTSWSKSYLVKNSEIKTKTMLKLTEVIDTYYEKGTEVNWALVKEHRMPTSFTISLENTCQNTITKIKLVKHLPEEFGEPIIDVPPQGDSKFDKDSRTIIWDGFNLVPGGVQSLIIRVGFEPNRIEPYDTGNIEVNYIVPDLLRSKISGTTNSHSDSLFAIDQGESMDEPGVWECEAEFENMSDFLVELGSVKVTQTLEGHKEVVVEENPNTVVPPDNSWTKEFKVKSGVVPKFTDIHQYNVVPLIHTKVIGHILYEAGVLPVAHILGEKIIDPPTVSAYTKTPMNISLIVTNAGSAVLNEVVFRDIIPSNFKPPELHEVNVSKGGEELRSGVIREMNPNDTDPESEHELIIKVEELEDLGGFQPENQIQVAYPIKAWDPKPKIKYPCHLNISSNVNPPGPPIKVPTIETGVEIKYVRRRIRAYKGQTPGSEPGEYIIPIVFENKGEVLIENITIKDIIPPNFSLLDWNPKDPSPQTQDTEKGTLLTWKLEKAEPSEKIKFSYTIKGTGEYEREELEVHVG